MAPPRSSRMQVLIYLVLVFALSSFFYFLILHSGSLANGRGMYVLGLMWCPALAALLTLRVNGAARAGGNRNSLSPWRARPWPPAWMAFFSRRTTIPRRPARMGQTLYRFPNCKRCF